jgi:mRNA interferase MazF
MNITKELIKTFTDWTKLKIRIHVSDRIVYPKKREIWWASLGQNIGVEINGKNDKFERPVLIIKAYSKDSSLVTSISSKLKEGKYIVRFVNSEAEENFINLSQIRTISNKRLLRKVGELEADDFDVVRNIIIEYI